MSMDKYLRQIQPKTKTKMVDVPNTSTPKRLMSTDSEDSLSMDNKKTRTKSPVISPIDESDLSGDLPTDPNISTTVIADKSPREAPQGMHGQHDMASPSPPHDPDFDKMFNAMAALLSDKNTPLYKSFAGVVKTMIHEDLEQITQQTVDLSSKVNQLDIEVIAVQNDQVSANNKLSDMEVRLQQLENSLAKQETQIIDQNSVIDANKTKIRELEVKNTELQQVQAAQGELNIKVNYLLGDVFNRVDELDQYGRRNMVRLSGIPESNTDPTDIVLQLARDLQADISRGDIDRCHRLGKLNPTAKFPRAIVIKFNNYTKRRELFDMRSKLKGSGIFFNDHLTPTRAKVMKKARDLKNKGAIANAWSSEGKLLCRDNDDNVHILTSHRDLQRFSALDDSMSTSSNAGDHQKVD